MKRNKDEFLSVLGVWFEIWKAIMEAVLNLGGTGEDLRRILRESDLRHEIAKLIVGERASVFPIWKSVVIGTKTSREEVIAGLRLRHYRLSDLAMELVRKMRLARVPTKLDLVKVTGADLGFNESGATTEEIFARANERGLGLCPAEVGPALRDQYSDQPMDEHLRIGMEPIDSDGSPRVFSVRRGEDGRWLHTDDVYSAPSWFPEDSWVFLRSK